MKSTSVHGFFQGNTAVFNTTHLGDMLYDLFDELGLEITYLRWDNEKKQFNVSFETVKDES